MMLQQARALAAAMGAVVTLDGQWEARNLPMTTKQLGIPLGRESHTFRSPELSEVLSVLQLAAQYRQARTHADQDAEASLCGDLEGVAGRLVKLSGMVRNGAERSVLREAVQSAIVQLQACDTYLGE